MFYSEAFDVRTEHKEIMTYLESVPKENVGSEIAYLTFDDLVELQKLIGVRNLNKYLADATKERIKVGKCEISCGQLICNDLKLHPSEYYVDSKNIVREVCPHILTLFIENTSKDINNFGLWDDCLGAAESVLEDLSIDLPRNSILNAAYITFLKFAKRSFPRLEMLSVTGWIDGILDIGKLCPEKELLILNLSNCDMRLIQWTQPPIVLDIDATECTNLDSFFSLLTENKPFRQAWVNPLNAHYFLDFIHNYTELSVRNCNDYFYYKRDPYILASNMMDVIQILKDLNVMREFIPLEHLFIDDLKPQQIDISAIQAEKTISHFTIFTSDVDFFETLLDELEFKRIVEVALIDATTKQLKEFIYMDSVENFVDLSFGCYILIKTNEDIKYLTLQFDEQMTAYIVNPYVKAFNGLKQLIFLKLTMTFPQLSGIEQSETFDRVTHFVVEEIEILSMKSADYKCVEIIFKSHSYTEQQIKDAAAAIRKDGDYYRLVFDALVDQQSIGQFIPTFEVYKSCKYMDISGTKAGEHLFNYMAENMESLKQTFSELKELKYIRVNVDKIITNLDILGIVFQSVEFIVLKFEPETKIVDKDIELFLNRLNEQRSQSNVEYKPEIDQQHNDNNNGDWFQLTKLSNRCKRTYVLSRQPNRRDREEKELEDFVEYAGSLQDKSNEITATKKKTYKKIKNLRDATILTLGV